MFFCIKNSRKSDFRSATLAHHLDNYVLIDTKLKINQLCQYLTLNTNLTYNIVNISYIAVIKINTMTTEQQNKLNQFKAAQQIALNVPKGCFRRATYENSTTNYCGYKLNNGRMYVIGDTDADIQNPDALINGKPAREIFGEFSIMSI